MSPSSSSHKSLSCSLLVWSPLQLFESCFFFFWSIQSALSLRIVSRSSSALNVYTRLQHLLHPLFHVLSPDASPALILPFSTLALFQLISSLLCQFFSMRLLIFIFSAPALSSPYLILPLCYLFPLPTSPFSRHH